MGRFFATWIFGPNAPSSWPVSCPPTDADAATRRDQEAAGLQARIKRIETAQNSCILELEQLSADPADTAAAMRTASAPASPTSTGNANRSKPISPPWPRPPRPPPTPALLDQIPALGDILPSLPPALKVRLFAAFDLEVLWNKPGQQATVFVEITDTTLQALPGILDPGQDEYHDTSTNPGNTTPDQRAPMGDLNNSHRCGREGHSLKTRGAMIRSGEPEQ